MSLPRDTSMDVFKRIQENGLLTHRRFQVYEYLFQHGPCTARQITLALRELEAFKGRDVTDSGFHGRLSELREQGVVREMGKVDGENGVVILWDVTSEMPKELPKKVSAKSENTQMRKMLLRAIALLTPAMHVPQVAQFIHEAKAIVR